MNFILVSLISVILVSCPDNKHHSTHRYGGHSRTKTKKENIIKKAPNSPQGSPKEGYIVDLEWVEKWDKMLKDNGDKLNPPRKPGDRTGIIIEGSKDRVNQKVINDFYTLKKSHK